MKWFSGAKGFGFIVPEGAKKGAKDLFVHFSSIEMEGFRELDKGDRVEFEIEDTDKGPQAVRVRCVAPSLTQGKGSRKPPEPGKPPGAGC